MVRFRKMFRFDIIYFYFSSICWAHSGQKIIKISIYKISGIVWIQPELDAKTFFIVFTNTEINIEGLGEETKTENSQLKTERWKDKVKNWLWK